MIIIDILRSVMTGFPGLGLIVAVGIVLFAVLTNMIVAAITFWKMRRWLKGAARNQIRDGRAPQEKDSLRYDNHHI